MRYAAITLVAALLAASSYAEEPRPPAGRAVDFEADVRPILAKSCHACHGPDKQRGGLRLDRKRDALAGGDGGPAVVPGRPAASPLLRLVDGTNPENVMPPKGERLSAAQVGVLRAWVEQGAKWPDDAAAGGGVWWSLRPLARPAVPPLAPADSGRARNPIDAFVLAGLRGRGLTPSPEADRRTLLRRVTLDLTGLPPSDAERDAFLADAAPDAYERVVDRLLASPRYGERWARHWLDAAHYGDSHGYDKDQPRPNAWPYRDYVIRSLNADKPYARFVQEQVAGDAMFPGTSDGVVALGFLAAGPWDAIGHAEVSEAKADGKVARHLDRDDVVGTVLTTVVSLTVQCAQCHSHKFDPIPHEDYYRLQAVFAAIDRGDRPYHADPAAAAEYARLTAARHAAAARGEAAAARVARLGGAELAALDARLRPPPAPRPEYGYHSALAARPDAAKWVQVDLGREVEVERVVLAGCHDDFNGIGAGFGFPRRFKVEACRDAAFGANAVVIADRTGTDFANPGVAPVGFAAPKVAARYVRVTATALAPRLNDFALALAELQVFAGGVNVAAGAAVTALDSTDAAPRWRPANLVDGVFPGAPAAPPAAAAERRRLLEQVGAAAFQAEADAATRDLAALDAALAKVPPAGVVYCGTVVTGRGNFAGTGASGGRPRAVHVLPRGDVRKPGREVTPGALSAVAGLKADFDLPAGHGEGDRRAALARWLTDPANPLTWRSAVNRAWHHHFGRGLVETPGDFGRMGAAPTHPELLDWLAAEFRDGGQSFKKFHRLVVTSATYRQSSALTPEAARLDAGNAYLARMPRRRLSAEEVRDGVLAASGKLDLTMYGPGFRDFVLEKPEHSPHYEYHLHDPEDPRSHRRAVYRFLARSKTQPFMTALDCADPSVRVDRRSETLSPLQALSLYNNGFMLAMAKHLAARAAAGNATPEAQVGAAFRFALGRPPLDAESAELTRHAAAHGLPNACRVILNLNEFSFVD